MNLFTRGIQCFAQFAEQIMLPEKLPEILTLQNQKIIRWQM
jgi:hypothetical protein